MKKILVIDNYDSFVYNIVQLIRESDKSPCYDIVRNDSIDFANLGQYQGIILSPGPGVPSESGDLLRLIDTCKHSHPLLGICLGHQAIAQSFGAGLYNLPYPLHGHRTTLTLTDPGDPLFSGITAPVIVGRYHSWVVSPQSFPEELLVSSLDEAGNIMSFRHSTLPIYGVQFHPESFISNCGVTILDNWLELTTHFYKSCHLS